MSSLSETIKVGAFVESVSTKERTISENDDDVPFSNLLKQCSVVSKRPPTPPRPPTPVKKEDTDNGNVAPRSLSHDDFIMVDLVINYTLAIISFYHFPSMCLFFDLVYPMKCNF